MAVNSKPLWRQREDALLVGAPLMMLAILSIMPVGVSLLISPAFPHARILGIALLPVVAACEIAGVTKIAFCLRSRFDVLSLFAAGTVVIAIVSTMIAGIVLASVLEAF